MNQYYSDEKFKIQAVELLSDSKSSVAIPAIKYLINISDDEKVKQACNLALKKLQLSGASEEKAQEYFKNIIKDSKPAEFYTTIPDGNGNQALLSSRINKNKKYSFSAVVVNDISGIIDCFGFYDIPESEFNKITEKFFNSEGQYKVSPEYIKFQTNSAFKLSEKLKKTLPYEFIAWNTLLADIEPKKDIITTNKKNYKKDKILEVLTLKYTYRWFITTEENKILKDLTDNICKLEKPDIETINQMFNQVKNDIFNNEIKDIWKNRLFELSYILSENDKQEIADKFLYIANNKDTFDLFLSIILQRSIVFNLAIIKNSQEENKKTINIFRRKTQPENTYNIKQIDEVLKVLKRNWINE